MPQYQIIVWSRTTDRPLEDELMLAHEGTYGIVRNKQDVIDIGLKIVNDKSWGGAYIVRKSGDLGIIALAKIVRKKDFVDVIEYFRH